MTTTIFRSQKARKMWKLSPSGLSACHIKQAQRRQRGVCASKNFKVECSFVSGSDLSSPNASINIHNLFASSLSPLPTVTPDPFRASHQIIENDAFIRNGNCIDNYPAILCCLQFIVSKKDHTMYVTWFPDFSQKQEKLEITKHTQGLILFIAQ